MSPPADLHKLRRKGKKYRNAFMASTVRGSIAYQVQALRGEMSQEKFAKRTGKKQTQISRLENADSGGVNLQTLIEIASELDIALLVKFVDYSTFLEETSDFSTAALRVSSIDELCADKAQAPAASTESTMVGTAGPKDFIKRHRHRSIGSAISQRPEGESVLACRPPFKSAYTTSPATICSPGKLIWHPYVA